MNGADGDNPSLHAFGRWRFDAGTGDLSDGTTTTRLEPQVAKLLIYFLAHQGTLVSRDELMAAVWDNRIVSDDAVNRCISILRQTLTPDDRNAFIETVVRRGFIGHFPPPLETAVPLEDPPASAQRRGLSMPWMLAAFAGIAALILFGALLGAFRIFSDSSPPGTTAERPAERPVERPVERPGVPMVAVLPFVSGGPGDSAFFASGMHDDLLTQLAQLQSMRVISRTSVSEYRDTQRNIREIGRELGADAILEGGVQQVGDQIRINAQLIDAHSDVHLWAQQYDRELTTANIFDIQTEIARSIASALDATLTQQDAAQLNVLPTENMAAYRAYHEAMKLRDTKLISAPAYIAALERAVALDPAFVRAWAELAGALSYINFGRRDSYSILRVEHMLERIRTLAPQSSEYLIAQAYYTYYVLKDYDRAYELIRQAQLLRPSDIQALELQSWIQRRQGDFVGVIESIRQARTLDPRSAYWTQRLVSNLMGTHRYDEALEVLENSLVESFRLAVLHSMLRVRDHQQPGRMLADLVTLQKEYGVEAEPFELWEAHIAARDYAGAAALLEASQAAMLPTDAWKASGVRDIGLARLITERFVEAQDPLVLRLAETRARLEQERDPGLPDADQYLVMAFIAAVEGNAAETERLVRTWRRGAAQDLAELTVLRHYACRALGVAGAASAAVECLRAGLAEPSLVMPFIEPFLPYYDALRDDPGFIEFLAEVEGE